jgi:hypothetical protein
MAYAAMLTRKDGSLSAFVGSTATFLIPLGIIVAMGYITTTMELTPTSRNIGYAIFAGIGLFGLVQYAKFRGIDISRIFGNMSGAIGSTIGSTIGSLINAIRSNIVSLPTHSWIFRILVLEAGVIGAYYLAPLAWDRYVVWDGTRLIRKNIHLTTQTSVMTYDPYTSQIASIHGESVGAISQNPDSTDPVPVYPGDYSISGRFFVEPKLPKSPNSDRTNDIVLVDYGEQPTIRYNPETDVFRITTLVDTSSVPVEIFRSNGVGQFPLQKWNHIVVNYSSGILDVFLNNRLVVGRREVLPIRTGGSMKMNIGASDGLYGGATNLTYYGRTLSLPEITWLYQNDTW